MRKLFGILIVIAIFAICLGFYRGWFTLSTSNPDADSDKTKVDVTVDRGKINEDAKAVKEKTTELTDRAKKQDTEPGH
jgi:hypothetical protein